MKYQAKININLPVIIAGLLMGGCAANVNSLDDQISFPGFRSEGKIAVAIKDRSAVHWVQATGDENYQAVDSLNPEDMRPSAASEYNLTYYLYGPDYRYPYGNRMWSQHRRRHYDLPWGYGYGYDPFYDPYYYDPFWGVHYRQSWGYNSWTDPYFDFYFYDPFSYSNYYSYQFDSLYWGHSRYYGTRSGYTYASSTSKIAKRRRLSNRGEPNYVRKSSGAAGQSNVQVRSTGTSNSSTGSTGYRVKSTGKSSSPSKSSGSKSSSKMKQKRRGNRDD